MLIPRPAYAQLIEPFIGQHVVKVLTGLRRCGKSSLLRLTADRLIAEGVPPNRIVYIDFESMDSANLLSAEALHQHLEVALDQPESYYVFFDEIQEVSQWERVVNSLLATRENVDIFLTGSNSRLLSSELATYIAGRYVSLPVSTLSFREHIAFSKQTDERATSLNLAEHFGNYLRQGGFPGLHVPRYENRQRDQAVVDIYNSALIQDTLRRRNIRNADMLKRIAAFALENVGNPFSARSVADYFKSQQRKVNPETVLNYLDALCEAFILMRTPRFDLQGKKLLTTNEKYYAGDHSLIHAVLGYQDRRLPGVLENIVGAELRLRGYETTVGKIGDREVDFVASRGEERLYVQVTTSLIASESTRERELAPLRTLRDSHPKLVLSLDQYAGGTDSGIQHCWLPQWLNQEPNETAPPLSSE